MSKRRFRLPTDPRRIRRILEEVLTIIPQNWVLEGNLKAPEILIAIGTALGDAYQVQYPDGSFEITSLNAQHSPVEEMRVRLQTSSAPLYAGTIHFAGQEGKTLKYTFKILRFYLDLAYAGHLLFAHRMSRNPSDEVTSCYVQMQGDEPTLEICSNLDSPNEIVDILNLYLRFELDELPPPA